MAYGLLFNGPETMDELLKMTRGDSDMTNKNPYMNDQIETELNILEILRQRNPLVICITNDVVRDLYSQWFTRHWRITRDE